MSWGEVFQFSAFFGLVAMLVVAYSHLSVYRYCRRPVRAETDLHEFVSLGFFKPLVRVIEEHGNTMLVLGPRVVQRDSMLRGLHGMLCGFAADHPDMGFVSVIHALPLCWTTRKLLGGRVSEFDRFKLGRHTLLLVRRMTIELEPFRLRVTCLNDSLGRNIGVLEELLAPLDELGIFPMPEAMPVPEKTAGGQSGGKAE